MEKDDKLQVHSANDWEDADLGDAARKQKFLKLMGAAKKEHHGKFIIGDEKLSGQHKRSQEEMQKMEHDLAEQYQTSLKNKLTGSSRHHVGLGFKAEEEKPESKDATPKDSETESVDDKLAAEEKPKKRKAETSKSSAGSTSSKDSPKQSKKNEKKLSENIEEDEDTSDLSVVKKASKKKKRSKEYKSNDSDS